MKKNKSKLYMNYLDLLPLELQVKIYIGAGSARIDGTPQFSFFSGFKLIE